MWHSQDRILGFNYRQSRNKFSRKGLPTKNEHGIYTVCYPVSMVLYLPIIKLSIKQLESIQPWNNDILRVLDRLYRPLWVTLYIIFYKEEANIVYA